MMRILHWVGILKVDLRKRYKCKVNFRRSWGLGVTGLNLKVLDISVPDKKTGQQKFVNLEDDESSVVS